MRARIALCCSGVSRSKFASNVLTVEVAQKGPDPSLRGASTPGTGPNSTANSISALATGSDPLRAASDSHDPMGMVRGACAGRAASLGGALCCERGVAARLHAVDALSAAASAHSPRTHAELVLQCVGPGWTRRCIPSLAPPREWYLMHRGR